MRLPKRSTDKVRTWLMTGHPVDRSVRLTTRPLEASAPAPLLDEIQTLHSMMGRDWVARGLYGQTKGEVELHFVAFDTSASQFQFLKEVNGHGNPVPVE